MPILTPKKDVEVNKPTIPNSIPPTKYSNVVDTRYKPASSLLTHIEGSSWVVTFYSQVLDNDNELQPQQLTLAPPYQQYVEIKKLELKVSSDLQTSQNDETKAMEVVGSATMYPFVIPNKGDMFIADIGDGRTGIFTITRSERRTILKETCYLVDYLLVSYGDEERIKDLNKKTIKKTHFIKSFLHFGQNPVVIDSEYNAIVELKKDYKRLLAHYFKDFYSNEIKTLIIPDQKNISYDPFLTKTLISILDTNDSPFIKNIRVLNVDGDNAMKAINIWDCLLNLSEDLIIMANYKYGLVAVENFEIDPRYNGIRYSGVSDVIYPLEERTDVDKDHEMSKHIIPSLIKEGKPRTSDIRKLIHKPTLNGFYLEKNDEKEGLESLPFIHLVTKDDFYVLSEAFYFDVKEDQSQLEVMVRQTLENKPLNLLQLKEIVNMCKHWNNLERFYYIPILLILIKSGLRGF